MLSHLSRALILAACASVSVSTAAAQQVWTVPPIEPVKPDAAPVAGPLNPIHLVAPRRGVASGQVVAAATAAVVGKPTDLTLQGGSARIPAANIQVRYATAQRDLTGRKDLALAPGPYCDALAESPVPGAKVQPVWITVTVPADATPGTYTGTLALTGGATAQFPVTLDVSAFTLTAPRDHVMWLALDQSINSISDRYNVPLYSDQHFQLLESSFRLLGQLGHHVLYIPVIEQNFIGTKRGLITFCRTAEKLDPDFAALDRYLQLQTKYCGTPRAVILELWQVYMAHRDTETIPGRHKSKAVLSVATGKGDFTTAEVPVYPANAEFWKDLYTQTLKHLTDQGIKPETVMLGFYSDRRPSREQVDFWKQAAPGAKWAGYTHGYAGYSPEGAQVGYCEIPDAYPTPFLQPPVRGGWESTGPFIGSCRDFAKDDSVPVLYRRLPDMAVGKCQTGPSHGLGRIGFDSWYVPAAAPPAPAATQPVRHMDPNDRLYSKHFRLIRGNARAVTVPGPSGALATVRFEMLREGVQDTEARIVLEKALLEKKLTGQLKADVEAALTDYSVSMWKRPDTDKTPPADRAADNWQQRAQRLYDLAGQVQQLSQ